MQYTDTTFHIEKQDFLTHTLFESFMEHSPAMAWISDGEGRIHYMNQQYRTTFNLSNEDLGRMPTIFPPDFTQTYIENNRKVIRENKPLELIEDGYDQQGNYLVCKVFKFPIHTKEGEVHVGAWMVDQTSVIQLEAELKKMHERYRYALIATSDIIWEWDLVRNEVYFGDGYKELLDLPAPYSPEQLFQHVKEQFQREVTSSLLQAVNGTALYWENEYQTVGTDNQIKTIINKALIIRGTEGKALRVIGALRDITEARYLQEQILSEQIHQKKKMIAAIIQAQEKERNKLSSELHDNVNQILASVKLMIEVLCDQTPHPFMKKSYEQIQRAIKEIRKISHELTPPGLGRNLEDAVREIINQINHTGRMKATFLVKDGEQKMKTLDSDFQVTLFRIIQEQINNILKHSAASSFQITLAVKKENLHLLIQDNGKGMDAKSIQKGLGLQNIFNRVEWHNGTAEINTGPGEGFRLMIEIPCPLSKHL